jgi:hypothetical protein
MEFTERVTRPISRLSLSRDLRSDRCLRTRRSIHSYFVGRMADTLNAFDFTSVPVFCPGRSVASVQGMIPDLATVSVCGTWEDLLFKSAVCRWGLAWKDVIAPSDLRAFTTWKQNGPHVSHFVLVTSAEPGNLLRLNGFVLAEIVPPDAAHDHIAHALLRTRASHWLCSVADKLEQSPFVDKTVAGMLAGPLRSAAPVRSTLAWTRLVGIGHRSTLWRRWNGLPIAKQGVRLQDYLDWLDVVRCALCKACTKSWRASASAFGISPEWLIRSCTRLTGAPPGECGPEKIVDCWITRVIRPLLDYDATFHQ